jgi:lipoprotein-releasing system ATP-binding protein
MAEPLLTVRNMDKRFPRAGGVVEVLRGCELDLAGGETVAIMGPSGAGKSTLLNILGALDSADGGTLRFEGAPLDLEDRRNALRWRRDVVGFIFQFHFLLPDFTARENLLLPVRARGGMGDGDRRRADELLAALELADRADHLPTELSGGQSQRVAVARAFMNAPRLVLADEPFGNLDRAISERLGALLFDLCRRTGVTMLLVTHDPELARRADRTLHLADGRLRPAGAPGSGP